MRHARRLILDEFDPAGEPSCQSRSGIEADPGIQLRVHFTIHFYLRGDGESVAQLLRSDPPRGIHAFRRLPAP